MPRDRSTIREYPEMISDVRWRFLSTHLCEHTAQTLFVSPLHDLHWIQRSPLGFFDPFLGPLRTRPLPSFTSPSAWSFVRQARLHSPSYLFL